VGDTLHDAEVAAAMGASAVLVDGGHQTAERLASSGLFVAASLTHAVRHIAEAAGISAH
jgi:phosphoglycolate phosphatase-like HAD superfamily hydrolase